jgi:hypothetical protein
MEFTPASLASQAAFLAIVVAVLGAVIGAVHHAYGSFKATAVTATLLGLWLGLQSALVLSGMLPTLPLMGLPVFFTPVLVVWIGLAFSPVGTRLVGALPLGALVVFQGFRLPLELVLHAWFKQGTIPETMTWSGQNWDIISGIVALVCAPLAGRFRAAARVANIVGFALLLNVMRVAILSSPVPFGWGTQPPLLLAFHLPYALIVPVCVGGALFGHILLTRALWSRSR